MTAFLNTASKTFARLRIKIPTLTSEDAATLPSVEKVTSAVSALTGLRGGATSSCCSSSCRGGGCGLATCKPCKSSGMKWVSRMIRSKISGKKPSPKVVVEDDDDEEDNDNEENEVGVMLGLCALHHYAVRL